MIAPKTTRFLLKYASSDPLKLADIARRRAIEQCTSSSRCRNILSSSGGSPNSIPGSRLPLP